MATNLGFVRHAVSEKLRCFQSCSNSRPTTGKVQRDRDFKRPPFNEVRRQARTRSDDCLPHCPLTRRTTTSSRTAGFGLSGNHDESKEFTSDGPACEPLVKLLYKSPALVIICRASSARPSTGWEIGITEVAIADVSLPPRAKISKLIRRLSGTLVIFFHAIAYARHPGPPGVHQQRHPTQPPRSPPGPSPVSAFSRHRLLC
jgi:hypothetical protein